jgi:hypothetical protein
LILKLKELIEKDMDFTGLTTDLWKAINNTYFIGVTCHWLTADFELKSAVLALREFENAHTADNIRAQLEDIAKDFNITKKVRYIYHLIW